MKRNICNLVLKNKTVLIRADLNVPLKPNGEILSTERITASLLTIVRALYSGAKVIIFSHLGRVKTEADKKKYSTFLVARELHRQLEYVLRKKINFFFSPFTSGKKVEDNIRALKFGEVLMLENTRFEDLQDKAESENNLELSKSWAKLANVFINDAFGTLHRSHSSNVGVAKLISKRGVGFLVEKEIQKLSLLIEKPPTPYIVIVGGAKVADKFNLLKTLLKRVDYLLVGGGIAYTFMLAIGKKIGQSLYEPSLLEEAKVLYKKYEDKIVLPVDFACGENFESKREIFSTIPDNLSAFDIGPETVNNFKKYIMSAKTIFWNGPLGVYEFSQFAWGTNEIAKLVALNSNSYTVVGGGDSAAAVALYSDKINHISTGGGASLAFLEEKLLPGMEVIPDTNEKNLNYCDSKWEEHSKIVQKRIEMLKVDSSLTKRAGSKTLEDKRLKKEIKLLVNDIKIDKKDMSTKKEVLNTKKADSKLKSKKQIKDLSNDNKIMNIKEEKDVTKFIKDSKKTTKVKKTETKKVNKALSKEKPRKKEPILNKKKSTANVTKLEKNLKNENPINLEKEPIIDSISENFFSSEKQKIEEDSKSLKSDFLIEGDKKVGLFSRYTKSLKNKAKLISNFFKKKS